MSVRSTSWSDLKMKKGHMAKIGSRPLERAPAEPKNRHERRAKVKIGRKK